MARLPVLQLSLRRQTFFFFFFNDTATTEIYTLSLHDALPILTPLGSIKPHFSPTLTLRRRSRKNGAEKSYRDRKSTRLNSSHSQISYAVFCLKKKKTSKMNVLILLRRNCTS